MYGIICNTGHNRRCQCWNKKNSAEYIPALKKLPIQDDRQEKRKHRQKFRMLFSEMPSAFMNSLLHALGIPAQNFMLNYSWSIVLMVLLGTWKSAGLYMIYFLSGLQAIPQDVYESAEIDGAGEWGKLRYITIPLLKPIAIYVFTILIFEGYRTFGESYVFWKESMPGNLGMTMVRYLYQQGFTYGNLGFGSAIGFVILGIVLLINLAQLRGFGLFNREG